MLRRAVAFVTLALVATASIVTASSATAAGPTCSSYGPDGTCLVWAGGGSDPGGGTGPTTGPGTGDGSFHLIQIDGHWCAPSGLKNPQPLPSEPVWQGHTDGAIYGCAVAPKVGPGGLVTADWTIWYWAATPPPPPPDPAVLAQQAVAAMPFVAGQIGLAPPAGGNSMGIVGMPTWMWISNPGESTTGPMTRSASAGGITVTATAVLTRVVWSMGDGQKVTCGGAKAPGTAYAASYGGSSSPTCGYVYTKTSAAQPGQEYTLTATSYWTVSWFGAGASGTIPLSFSRSIQQKVGEYQVIVTNN